MTFTLQAVILADSSFQQPPLFSKHSFVSTSARPETNGSGSTSNSRHDLHCNTLRVHTATQTNSWLSGFLKTRTDGLQNSTFLQLSCKHIQIFYPTKRSLLLSMKQKHKDQPRYCRLLTTRVGNIVTSPLDPFPT